MLKERKLLRYDHEYYIGNKLYQDGKKNIVGRYTFWGSMEEVIADIIDDKNMININEEDYYFTEFETNTTETDYHTYCDKYHIEGVYLAFNLNVIDTLKYFNENLINDLFNKKEFLENIKKILLNHKMIEKYDKHEILIHEKGYLQIILPWKKLDNKVLSCSNEILNYIRNYYDEKGIHITRMFGSYILLKKIDGELKAIHATEVPIKYCPLMIKLLKEVGGNKAETLLNALKENNTNLQKNIMLDLINEVVIRGGYFDTSRPLNSCEANVVFGASESLSSAFINKIIDAAVIVSNNLGTIITTNSNNTQGSVKRMTGLFYTSPNEEIFNTALSEKIIPVFPYTAEIDQLEGVKKAIDLGYKNIAVTVAANDNYLLEEIKKLETKDIKVYKFGLCSTGISKETAMIMKENADVVWSCASKYVKELIEPNAIAQVGIKIPVHIMNERGWYIIQNHLQIMNDNRLLNVNLSSGINKPIILNQNNGLKLIRKKDLHNCNDCPHPCI